MKKNLLIGNGVNLNTDNTIFSPNNIRDRFYSALYNAIYTKEEQELKCHIDNWLILAKIDDVNIEKIANNAYVYIKNNMVGGEERFVGSNNDYRVKNILTNNALNAIFIENEKFINIEIYDYVKDEISKYDNIYTLNYNEYWDDLDRVEYLHGKIKIICLMNKYSIDVSECIFAMEEEQKSEVYIKYPSENLTPASDLFPGGKIKLYEELKGLDEISIFGVSPFGDSQLLDSVKSIRQKTIFVHGMNRNEIREWKKHFGESTFLNSSEFTNERSKYE